MTHLKKNKRMILQTQRRMTCAACNKKFPPPTFNIEEDEADEWDDWVDCDFYEVWFHVVCVELKGTQAQWIPVHLNKRRITPKQYFLV